MSRCIDQRFLLNIPSEGKQSRSDWIEEWLLHLGNLFAIDIYSFAIMGNHIHTVLYVNHDMADSWDGVEVLKRRIQLGKVPRVCYLYLNDETRQEMKEIETTIVLELIEKYRAELTNISTFMSRLNSYIAHRANKEDGRKGHFWEGRFKSQALLTQDAVLACMAYVDLNPMRAGIAKTLSEAKNTSISRRLLRSKVHKKTRLLPFRKSNQSLLLNNVSNLYLADYSEIIECIISGTAFDGLLKRFTEFIENDEDWTSLALDFENQIGLAAGDMELVNRFEKQARLCAFASDDTFKDVAARILFELRDSQYPCDRMNRSNSFFSIHHRLLPVLRLRFFQD